MLIHNLVATGSLSYNGVNISYVTGSQTSLDGLNQFSSSVNLTTGSLNSTTGSLNTATGSLFTASGSFSTRVTKIEGNYATTGSNIFLGAQTVCANITSTGTIIAQTLNVQQVTSSIVYSSGSNTFGCQLTDVQQMTGSVRITGSLNVTGNTCVVSICSPAHVGGTFSGTTIYGSTAICGAVICGGATTLTGALSGTSATFSSTISLNDDFTLNSANPQIKWASGNLRFSSVAGGTDRMVLTSAGAATFSSSVTAGGSAYFGTFNGSNKYYFEPFSNLAGGANNAYLVSGKADNNERSGFVFQARNSNGEEYNVVAFEGYNSTSTSTAFAIGSTGAATFASSILATSATFSGGDVRISSDGTYGSNYGMIGFGGNTNGSNRIFAGIGTYDHLYIASGTNLGIAFWTGGSSATRMFITSGGNVGIGTTTPQEKFEVCGNWGNIRTYGRGGVRLNNISNNLYYNGSAWVRDNGSYGAQSITFDTDGDLIFETTAATSGDTSPRMTIAGGGDISITCNVNINGNITLNTGANRILRLGSASAYYYDLQSVGDNFEIKEAGTTTRMKIFYPSGVVCFSSTICAPCFATISDYRMKSNLRPIEGLSIIMNTKPYKFEYNYDCSTSFGMIAHELQDVVPEAVFGHKDGDVMQGVDYMKLLPIAIKAIQELKCENDIFKTCLGII